MNRSILIVICDFLLVSLLAFSTVDPEALTGDSAARKVKLEMTVSNPDTKQDLASVMRLALDDEKQARELLLSELARTRDSLGQQQSALAEIEKQAAERARQVEQIRQALQAREQESRQIERERNFLADQYASVQTNMQVLQRALSATSGEALINRELASVTREELRREQERAAALQQQVALLERSNQVVQTEKIELAGRLQVSEVEKRAAAEQAVRMQNEVKVVREEKAALTAHADKLAEGVKTLAGNSGELAREIRDNRPLPPNVLFSEFATNRVRARLHAYKPGLLGLDQHKRRESDTILFTDGTNYAALCHVEDTPLALANPGTEWVSITGSLNHGATSFSLRTLGFALMDPRIVFMPLTQGQAASLGVKVYRISMDPFKFQDALLVGANEGYYGECKFEVDLTTPHYVKMDRSFVKGLFGKFNPSRGDLVLSKNGELLGIMANNTYCLRVLNFNTAAAIQFGTDVREQHPADVLARLHMLVYQMPFKLK